MGGSITVVAGDFTGDGVADLVVTNYIVGASQLLRGAGDGTFAPQDLTWPGVGVAGAERIRNDQVLAGDFDGDTIDDVIIGGGAGVVLLIGGATGLRGSASFIRPGMQIDVAAGNFAGDSVLDVLVVIHGSPEPLLFVDPGLNGFGEPRVVKGLPAAHYMAIGDVNRDGWTDVVAAGEELVQPFLGDGTGAFSAGPTTSTAAQLHPLAGVVTDLDGDGLLDLIGYDVASASVHVMRGSGHGAFLPAHTIQVGVLPEQFAFVPGDFDGDGYTDLAIAMLKGQSVVVLLNADLMP